MRPLEYKKLEDNKTFKRYYMRKTKWWKSFLLLAPTLLLFVGLAGILHMAYNDRIWTLYCLPYIIVFALGTIWLKGIKKYIQDKLVSQSHSYLACAAKSLGEKGGRHYFIYSKDNKRHNETLISRLADELDLDNLTKEQIEEAKKASIKIETSETETPIYLKAIATNLVLKANRENLASGITPLLYISLQDVFVIRNKDFK